MREVVADCMAHGALVMDVPGAAPPTLRVPPTRSRGRTVEFTAVEWTDFLSGAEPGEFDVAA
ncbi:hypothetical protein ABWJ92_27855 [Streptomyces sp. NPDC000609]|uniref:hypothetical protein n=1 Tax=Streptomyces sp. NPDC000609 TaxID=3160957 RepID=UPI0033912127